MRTCRDQHFQFASLRLVYRPVDSSPSTGAVIAAVARHTEPAILDSARSDPAHGRFTIIACNPLARFISRPRDDPFAAVRDLLARTGMLSPAPFVPHPSPTLRVFAGGWIGYFAYEAGRFIEHLPSRATDDIGLPVARFGLYDSAAVYDHLTGQWTIAASDFGIDPLLRSDFNCPTVGWKPESENLVGLGKGVQVRRRQPIAERLAWWEALLAAACTATTSVGPTTAVAASEPESKRSQYGPLISNLSPMQFVGIVRRAREYIAAGDIFQVNLARRETVRVIEPPVDVYLRLRRTNPGVYSAFLAWQDPPPPTSSSSPAVSAILSSSPELFLRVDGRHVVTRPIKGTRPRSADRVMDQLLRLELAASTKDRAELAMIVDLLWNDLGRVCEYGSIQVVEASSPATPYALESHPTVFHLAATVKGRLAERYDVIDLLRAAFPDGSITGAPKVRAMEIIDELEPTQRSVYTGSIGYFAPGRMVMNIAIRTMIQTAGHLHWYSGGGIVADSDPVGEYEETCAKALGMQEALGIKPRSDGRGFGKE